MNQIHHISVQIGQVTQEQILCLFRWDSGTSVQIIKTYIIPMNQKKNLHHMVVLIKQLTYMSQFPPMSYLNNLHNTYVRCQQLT